LIVLSAMSQEEIESLFYHTELNEAGIYLVYLYVNGVRTSVIVDDYLPCFNED